MAAVGDTYQAREKAVEGARLALFASLGDGDHGAEMREAVRRVDVPTCVNVGVEAR